MAEQITVELPEPDWTAHIMETSGLGWAALIYKPSLLGARNASQICVFKACGFDGPGSAENAIRDAAARICKWWNTYRE